MTSIVLTGVILGAGVVCCQQQIDPFVSDALLANNILPIERLSSAKHAAPAVAALSGLPPLSLPSSPFSLFSPLSSEERD